MFTRITILILVLAMLSVNSAVGQESRYRYTHYSVEDGLPNPMVYDVLQARDGFIWMATESGLVRFDGYEFKVYTTEDGLPENDVLKLFEDNRGRIWMKTFGPGLCYLDNDSFHYFSHPELPDDAFVFGVNFVGDSLLLLGTARTGLFIFKGDSLVEHILHFEGVHDPRFQLVATELDSKGNIWTLHYRHYGCCGLQPDSIYQVDSTFWGGAYDSFILGYLGRNFGMGIISRKNVLVHRDGKQVLIFPRDTNEEYDILGIDTLANGDIAISTRSGAYQLHLTVNNEVIITPLLLDEPTSSVYEDKEGNLWISTLDNGVFFINSATQNIEVIIDDNIMTIAEYKGALYFGSLLGKLYVIENDTIVSFQVPGMGTIQVPGINDIVVDTVNNYIYIGTDKYIVRSKGGSFEPNDVYLDYRLILSDQVPGKILRDSLFHPTIAIGAIKNITISGDYVYAASGNGMFGYYKSGTPQQEVHFFDNKRVLDVAVESNGKVWAARLDGLYTLDDTLRLVVPKGAFGTYINRLEIDNKDRLWIGTNGAGLFLYECDKLSHIRLGARVGSNIVNDMLILSDLEIALVATNMGVFEVKYDNGMGKSEVFPLLSNSGLPSLVVNRLYFDYPVLYVATAKGLAGIRYQPGNKDTTICPLMIHSVTVNGEEVDKSESYMLRYDENDIRISYAGLSYSSQRQIMYRYRLEETDTGWKETDLTELQFSSLPPGRYTFSVKAKGLNGVWHNEYNSIKFHIHPPYWQTLWFQLLMGLVFIAVVMGVAAAIIRSNRRKDAIARQLMELEGQALRAQMNPHFIFNSLNAVHDFIADSDQRSAHLYLSRFAKLIRRILDQSRRTWITLAEEIETLDLYVQLEQMRFEGKFEFRKELSEGLDSGSIKIPPMIIQPYLENAIRHGVMNRTEPGGRLTLCIFTETDSLICVVEDNGIGRVEAGKISQRNGTEHKSHAMDITRERLVKLRHAGKEIGQVDIEDKTDEKGQSNGTKVTIKFFIRNTE